MTDRPIARSVQRGEAASPATTVTLDYEGRFLRRRRLVADDGTDFVVDLSETVSLEEGDALVLDDGRRIGVRAAPEALVEITGDLPRLAWHIGNRHTPCEILPDRLVIREDHVLRAMLERLGAQIEPVHRPFRPEGGAYGHGRTMGHDHGEGLEHRPHHHH